MTAERPRPRELYRDPAHGRVAGVCAGLAHYFGWPIWPLRLGIVFLAVFTQVFPVVAAYLIAWFILDPISPSSATGLRGQMNDWVMKTRQRWDQDQGRTYQPPANAPKADVEMPESTPSPEGRPESRATANVSAFREPACPANAVAIDGLLQELEGRVRAMERHVTEPAFVLRQQFQTL